MVNPIDPETGEGRPVNQIKDTSFGRLPGFSDKSREDGNRQRKHIAEMPAFKSTELLDAAIDAYGVGVSLRGISVATDMTEVKPTMHSALMTEKSAYNRSRR